MDSEKPLTLHMIGHGHIDPTWLWRWTEGYEEVRATFRSALARMDETPDLRFTASSACFYQWVKDTEPELFEAIRARVAEGRWEIAGGLWVEPDCNIPCGESFARHGLYSQRFFHREFGKRARVAFNPDSFGHAGTLPQIFRKLGMDRYVYMRPSPVREMDYPDGTTFWWEAPDGSRVLACNLPESYNAVGEELRDRMARLPRFPHLNPGQRDILCFFGVGNHGGGPTKEAVAHILSVQAQGEGAAVRFSTLGEYFDAFQAGMDPANVPVIRNELQHHARGCYSVHAEVKRLNRRVEHALMTAERFAAAAWLLDARDYPADQLEKAWQDLLYNQFHDILAGTSLESSYADTRDALGAARHRADVIRNQAIQGIARGIDTTPEGNTLVVVNPLAWPVECPVLAPPAAARTLAEPLHLVDDSGAIVPLQTVRGERIDHVRRAFVAELPAMGYRCYHLRSGAVPVKAARGLEASPRLLENDWWRLAFDPESGALCELFDKQNRVSVLRGGLELAALVDHSDTWGHDIDGWRVEAGRFSGAVLDVAECGEVLATVRSRSRFRNSEAVLELTLHRDLPLIDCFLRVNWQEAYTLLKLGFDTHITGGAVTAEAPYGHQERPTDGGEEPCQQWIDLSGEIGGMPYGLAVLNDGQYGYDARGGVLRMTLLRSPAYAHHDNGRYDARAGWPLMDQGWHETRLHLLPHAGGWRGARVPKKAWELNVPPVVHVESAHPGHRPQRSSLLGTESGNVLLSVIKCAEDGDDLVIRGYETDGLPADTRLHLPHFDKTYDLHFAPHEIKTLRIHRDTWEMRETNLLEE
ncbi:MAG: alpha-mannosidase [Candidatus Hydrogenedens sp.]|nr:alpha-mannosidase [Candidatus Hydrogenedentota bacterium]NLF57742.1 alpha-mannosidase [Candidatus Hydrogenedens sp.]